MVQRLPFGCTGAHKNGAQGIWQRTSTMNHWKVEQLALPGNVQTSSSECNNGQALKLDNIVLLGGFRMQSMYILFLFIYLLDLYLSLIHI